MKAVATWAPYLNKVDPAVIKFEKVQNQRILKVAHESKIFFQIVHVKKGKCNTTYNTTYLPSSWLILNIVILRHM